MYTLLGKLLKYINKYELILKHNFNTATKVTNKHITCLTNGLSANVYNIRVSTIMPQKQASILHFAIIYIGVAPITHLRTCVMKIVTFKGGHLMW